MDHLHIDEIEDLSLIVTVSRALGLDHWKRRYAHWTTKTRQFNVHLWWKQNDTYHISEVDTASAQEWLQLTQERRSFLSSL